MHIPPLLAVCVALLVGLAACSPDPDSAAEQGEEEGRHVWKGQTEAIDKAREVETILKRKQQQENQ